MQGPCWAGAITQHFISLALLTTSPSLDPLCRQAQDNKQDTMEEGRNSGKGKGREVETRTTIPAKHIPCRNYKHSSQNGLHAANENVGSEELH